MARDIVKFRLNKEMAKKFYESDFEYTAHIGENKSIITWVEDETEQETYYSTSEVKTNFKNGTWIKL